MILSSREPREIGEMVPIGARADLVGQLAEANTAPESDGTPDVLYGPGIRIEMTPGQDPVTQMLVTITEEEIGWQVLARLMGKLDWKLLDPNTGRELTSAATDGRG